MKKTYIALVSSAVLLLCAILAGFILYEKNKKNDIPVMSYNISSDNDTEKIETKEIISLGERLLSELEKKAFEESTDESVPENELYEEQAEYSEPEDDSSSSTQSTSEEQEESAEAAPSGKSYEYYKSVEPTYIDGILLVNKNYALPSYFGGSNSEANEALSRLQSAAASTGYSMPLISGYRSFSYQDGLYRRYAERDGKELANTYSAWPGHSEHQTGLAFDIGELDDSYGETEAGRWLAENAHHYGFIIRYPKGKESITGYQYEPWHVRYLGVDTATKVYESGLCLEEYLL